MVCLLALVLALLSLPQPGATGLEYFSKQEMLFPSLRWQSWLSCISLGPGLCCP